MKIPLLRQIKSKNRDILVLELTTLYKIGGLIMKKIGKLFWIVILMTVMGFSITACKNDPDPNPFEGVWSGFDPWLDKVRLVFTASNWSFSYVDWPGSGTGAYICNGNTAIVTSTPDPEWIPNGSPFTISGNTLTMCYGGSQFFTLTKGNEFVYVPSASAIPLTVNQWKDGIAAEWPYCYSDYPGDDWWYSPYSYWYSFPVSAGQTYYLWGNDHHSGDGTKTGEHESIISYSDGTIPIKAFEDHLSYSSSISFTSDRTDTLYIKVIPARPGTYAIAYNTSNTRP